MTKTFTVRGVKMRTATQRRYVAVAVRPAGTYRYWDAYEGATGAYVEEELPALATILRRSDRIEPLRAAIRRTGRIIGAALVVVDTLTGEEI